jgi:alpha-mannosidase
MVDVVKKAEDNDDIILRLYEAYGRRSNVDVILSGLPTGYVITECDLLEKLIDGEFECPDENRFAFTIKPYEIKTFRLHTRNSSQE